MSKTLTRRLEKSKEASFIMSFRIPRSLAVKLARIENQADIRFDTLTRLLLRSLVRQWEENQSIELPAYVALMSVKEARRLGLPGAGDSNGSETSD